MEFKEFFKILQKEKKTFFAFWLAAILLGLGFFVFQKEKYEAVVSIDIARDETPKRRNNPEYEFDQFYRLEADDRFAKNVVAWLKDPNVLKEVSNRLKEKNVNPETMKKTANSLEAKQLASNYIKASFVVSKEAEVNEFFLALRDETIKKAEHIGQSEEGNWFKIVFSGPAVSSTKLPFSLILSLALALGLFGGIFLALGRHYWRE